MSRILCFTAAQALGADRLALNLWNAQPSDRHFEHNTAAYPKLAATAEGYGLTLMIKNAVYSCLDPRTLLTEPAQAYPDISFVYDTKMAAFHQQDDRLYDPDCAWLTRRIHTTFHTG